MLRINTVLIVGCFCGGLLLPTANARQIPTTIPAPKKTIEKPGTTVYPDAGKNGYTMPRCIHCPQPQYPDKEFRQKVTGKVRLRVVVLASGFPGNVRVIKSPDKGLAEISVKTVHRKWLFKPALGPNGKPAAVQMVVEVTFALY